MSIYPKHIVFVSPYGHHGAQSGARKRVESLCKAILSLAPGIKLTCLSPWPPIEGVTHVPFSLEGSAKIRLVRTAWLTIRLVRLRPDLVISESPLSPLPFGRYRLMHVIHDAKFASSYARRSGRLAHTMHWLSSHLADHVVTVSESEHQRLAAALPPARSKLRVSYNGLSDAWLYTPRPPSGVARQYDLLYVSNFARHKGHRDLLRSLHGQRWRIAFVGADFGEREDCERLAENWGIHATFLSGLSEQELIATYDDARVFVFPSRLEGFGMPFLEARARGLPVLANDIPVFRELQALIGGEIVDFADIESVTRRVSALLDSPLDTVELRHFGWDQIARDLIELPGGSH